MHFWLSNESKSDSKSCGFSIAGPDTILTPSPPEPSPLILVANVGALQELQNIQYLAFAPRMSEPVDQSYKPVLTSGSQSLFALVNLKETIGPCASTPPRIVALGAVSLMHGY